jgi:hypothetical protein
MNERILRAWMTERLLCEANLGSKSGLFKYRQRAQDLRDLIATDTPLALAKGPSATGETFVITQNKQEILQVLDDIIAIHNQSGGRARVGSGFASPLSKDPLYIQINQLLDASSLSLTKLHKSKDLGGEAGGAREKCEAGQIAQIQVEIEKLKSNPDLGGSISIKLGKTMVKNVVGIVKVTGTPKADGALVDSKGNQIAWISFKCADEGKNMQQWGGLSQHQSVDIDDFEKDIAAYIQINGRIPKEGFYRPLTDKALASRAVWGLDVGGQPGPENVNTLIATLGTIGLSEISPGTYKFIAGGGGVHHDGVMPTGTFEPVLGATYRAGRGKEGLVDVRVGIYPAGFRAKWVQLPEPDKDLEIIALEANESLIRLAIRETFLHEELTKSDKKEIEKIAKKHAKAHFDKEIDKTLGTSFFGNKGKVSKFVDDEIDKRFKSGDKDKDFSSAVEKVTKRVIQALYTMHYKRNNLIKSMPVPKS